MEKPLTDEKLPTLGSLIGRQVRRVTADAGLVVIEFEGGPLLAIQVEDGELFTYLENGE